MEQGPGSAGDRACIQDRASVKSDGGMHAGRHRVNRQSNHRQTEGKSWRTRSRSGREFVLGQS